jgi:hypothetical protein
MSMLVWSADVSGHPYDVIFERLDDAFDGVRGERRSRPEATRQAIP